jgi:hypothetical protein
MPVGSVLLAAILAAPLQSQGLAQTAPAKTASRLTPRAKAAADPSFADALRGGDWYNFGPPKEADVEKEAPGVQLKIHDPQADSIIVYGERHHRDFEGAAPVPNLTSPQALQAAQPVVPGIGESCSYKYGCFDSGQTPLRDSVGSLLGLN